VEVGISQMQNALHSLNLRLRVFVTCAFLDVLTASETRERAPIPRMPRHTFARDPNSIGPARDLLKVRSL